jgi:citrate synthase
MMEEKQTQIIEEILTQSKANGGFDPAEFSRYQVKPGLRNADGTGVVAGLTRI